MLKDAAHGVVAPRCGFVHRHGGACRLVVVPRPVYLQRHHASLLPQELPHDDTSTAGRGKLGKHHRNVSAGLSLFFGNFSTNTRQFICRNLFALRCEGVGLNLLRCHRLNNCPRERQNILIQMSTQSRVFLCSFLDWCNTSVLWDETLLHVNSEQFDELVTTLRQI